MLVGHVDVYYKTGLSYILPTWAVCEIWIIAFPSPRSDFLILFVFLSIFKCLFVVIYVSLIRR
jgi:hypothetical protein